MMLNKIKRFLGRKMGVPSYTTIRQALGDELMVSPAMDDAIRLWGGMYAGSPPWMSDKVKTLNLAPVIAAEVARLTTIEMRSRITGSARADWLNGQYGAVVKDARRFTEHACALGGLALKPYVDGAGLKVDYVRAGDFYPTAFNGAGEVTGAAFIAQLCRGGRIYTRLERHELTPGGYRIGNTAYVSDYAGALGRQVALAEVDEWADIAPSVAFTGVDVPLFAYFKTPAANTVDYSSPLGVSVYSRAAGLLEEADNQYSRLLWEFEATEAAIDVDVTALMPGASELPRLNGRLFRGLDLSGGNRDFYSVYSPAIRDQSYIAGLNEIIMRIEDACGLARGTFSRPGAEARTATELKIMRQRTYATIVDTQKALQDALATLARAMDAWASLYNLAPPGKYDVSFEWDDSIVTDADVEFARRMQMVAAGILKPEALYAWYFGVSEGEALESLPKAVSVFGSDA